MDEAAASDGRVGRPGARAPEPVRTCALTRTYASKRETPSGSGSLRYRTALPSTRSVSLPQRQSPRRVTTHSLDQQAAHHVRIHVGVGATVFQPPLLRLGHGPGNPDRGTAVRGPIAEGAEVRSLVCTRETGLDSHAVVRHVLVNPLPDGLAARDDGVPSTVLPHGLGGEVGVRPGAVPVAQDRLGLQGRRRH